MNTGIFRSVDKPFRVVLDEAIDEYKTRYQADVALVALAHPATCDQRLPHAIDGALVVPTYSLLPDSLWLSAVGSYIDYYALLRSRNMYEGVIIIEPDPGDNAPRVVKTVHIPNDDEREVFPILRRCTKVVIYPGDNRLYTGELYYAK